MEGVRALVESWASRRIASAQAGDSRTASSPDRDVFHSSPRMIATVFQSWRPARRFMGPGRRLRFHAKRKGGQAIENKQFCEMAYFASPMISMTSKPFVSLGERKSFAFAVFPPRRGPRRKGAKSTADSGLASDVARVSDSEMAPQAVGIAQNGLASSPRRFQSLGGRIDQANSA